MENKYTDCSLGLLFQISLCPAWKKTALTIYGHSSETLEIAAASAWLSVQPLVNTSMCKTVIRRAFQSQFYFKGLLGRYYATRKPMAPASVTPNYIPNSIKWKQTAAVTIKKKGLRQTGSALWEKKVTDWHRFVILYLKCILTRKMQRRGISSSWLKFTWRMFKGETVTPNVCEWNKQGVKDEW